MNQALSQIKQKDISALQYKKSALVENCIKACNILIGDTKKYPDAKKMIVAFSQKASFVLDLMKRVDPDTNDETSPGQVRAVGNLLRSYSF